MGLTENIVSRRVWAAFRLRLAGRQRTYGFERVGILFLLPAMALAQDVAIVRGGDGFVVDRLHVAVCVDVEHLAQLRGRHVIRLGTRATTRHARPGMRRRTNRSSRAKPYDRDPSTAHPRLTTTLALSAPAKVGRSILTR